MRAPLASTDRLSVRSDPSIGRNSRGAQASCSASSSPRPSPHAPAAPCWCRLRRKLFCAPLRPPCVKPAYFGGRRRTCRIFGQRRVTSSDTAQPCRFWLCERRGWDSNPRVILTATADFQDSIVWLSQAACRPLAPPDAPPPEASGGIGGRRDGAIGLRVLEKGVNGPPPPSCPD
jgi:hypothetical protein